jgi:hypothetical protein
MNTQHIETETYITPNDVFVITQTIDGETNTIFIVGELAEQVRKDISNYLLVTDYKRKN